MIDLLPIDFRRIRNGLVKMLDIQGGRARPSHIDMSRIQPVVEVGSAGDVWLSEESTNDEFLAASCGMSLDGEMSTDMQLVAYAVTKGLSF